MAETGKEARPPLLRADAALFLDFDGTLAAYASHPDGVTIEAGLPALLARLREGLHGALAIVTGRTLEALDTLLGPPRYAAAGLHGLEWRLAAGKTHRSGNPVGAGPILAALGIAYLLSPWLDALVKRHKRAARRSRRRALERRLHPEARSTRMCLSRTPPRCGSNY